MNNSKQLDLIEAPLFEGSPTNGTELVFDVISSVDHFKNLSVQKYVEKIDLNVEKDSFGTKNIKAVMTKCESIRLSIANSLRDNHFPIVVGGDHSVAMSSIAADSEMFGINNLAVIYIDGHCDINTEETSTSHNIHGMPLASSLGLCHKALQVGPLKQKIFGNNLFILGARSIDEPEFNIIEDNKVNLYKNSEITNETLPSIFKDLQKSIGHKKVHISFDVDALDPSVLSSTGYVMPNGLSLEVVKNIIDFAFKNFDVISFDIVEYNPLLDKEKRDLKVVLDILDLVVDNVESKDIKHI